ncbi:SpoIIE family protein phosphatase [Coraliomargarita sp. SDUM461004]|uniref:SpoIIE family protein phosphatase n=1 Tax=Thalassobacterium sedimentorum TaxID=3041258 RepID=A0ABU1AI04_9BACT|nr:SpoIIE family protein phosphatase [Coraliomargarita sp. SDUM461004]MDQ8193818.1 SpoIIE family protein phosphatase [Coraliomargarita sp. SDUM461004]
MPEESALYVTEFKLRANVKEIPAIRERFIDFLLSLGLDDSEKDGWKLAFTELVNNAIEHGCKDTPDADIYIRWWSVKDSVWLLAQDSGQGPADAVARNPTLPEDPLSEGGRGLYIVHEFADQFDHWRCARGYIAQVGKFYKRLNSVLPLNPEMDAILDELSDCYESLSLFDRMAANLLQDERIDRFVQSGLNMFMDARDYSAIHLELYQPEKNQIYHWLGTIKSYGVFGHVADEDAEILQKNDSINWSTRRNNCPFSEGAIYPVGCCVPLYVGDQIVGLIAVGCEDEDHVIVSNDIRNLRALADIIGVSISRELLDLEKDARKRLATEMHIATELQQKLLPTRKVIPEIPGYELFFSSLSALEVAGDFVEVRQNRSGEYLGCVIDVMGKGVSAAILAGIFRSQFIAYSYRGGNLATFIEGVNQALESQLEGATMFITTFVFKLNPESNSITYTAAGHPPALLFSADGSMRELISTGPPIGLFPEVEYAQHQIELSPQDRLVVVTDGLYEWTQGKDIFGWEAMVQWFSSNNHLDAETLWTKLQSKMLGARKLQAIEQEDDETLLILTRK